MCTLPPLNTPVSSIRFPLWTPTSPTVQSSCSPLSSMANHSCGQSFTSLFSGVTLPAMEEEKGVTLAELQLQRRRDAQRAIRAEQRQGNGGGGEPAWLKHEVELAAARRLSLAKAEKRRKEYKASKDYRLMQLRKQAVRSTEAAVERALRRETAPVFGESV